jgi:hypothetical protein
MRTTFQIRIAAQISLTRIVLKVATVSLGVPEERLVVANFYLAKMLGE